MRNLGKPSVVLLALALATAAWAVVAAPAAGQEAEITYTGSLQGASGTYTLSETTRSLLFFNGLSVRKGRWNLSASVPVIYQDSPYVTYAGGTPVPSGRRLGSEEDSGTQSTPAGAGSASRRGGTVVVPDPATLDFSETGVGDPVFRADFSVSDRTSSRPRLGLYAATKPPLADEDSGFGTGEWDYGAGLTISKQAGSILLLADLGYWIYGDPSDFEIKDPLAFSLAMGRPFADSRSSILGSVWGSTETVDGIDGPVQLGVTLSRLVSSGRSLSVTLSAGLTESAPDYSLAAGWRVGL